MKNKLAAWIALGLIAVFAAVCLGVTDEITRDVIKGQAREAMEASWRELLPDATFPEAVAAEDGDMPQEYVYAGYRGDEVIGYVAQVAVSGYAGEIEIIVGTDTEGTLSGISVGGVNFAETAGLGAKAKNASFTDQFAGKTAPLAVGENIDAITAATITSSAVVRGVNTAIERIGEVAGFEIASSTEGGALGDGRYSATVRGFAGPVYVELTLDDAGVIESIIIGDDAFAETAGYGLKAQEPAFYEQFIGKSGSVELGVDIDAITGATITSKAVVDAVNLALLYHADPEAAAASGTQETVELPEIPADALTESASSKGFAGPVEAKITVDAAGEKLLMVEFGGDKWAETEGFGSRVLEPEFWHQFINQDMPVDPDLIDTLAGATITSEAAIAAVNKAYEKLFPAEEAPVAEETAAVEQDANVAEASSKGFAGPVAVKLTVDENDAIAEIVIGNDKFAETEGFGTKALEPEYAAQFTGKALPLNAGDVDVITGATVTSEAVIAAVNKAYDKIVEARGAEPEVAEAPVVEAAVKAVAEDANTAEASSKGFVGPVAVKLTVDENNAIAEIVIGDDKFAETEGFGTKALEPEFAAQFKGKALPLNAGDVDVITGATVTSEAVIAAVNDAYAQIVETRGAETEVVNTAEASSKGFAGPVAVKLTVDENNAIAEIIIGDDKFAETEGFGTKALEPAFAESFKGKALPLKDGDIDVIAGATVTSKAVIEAVNMAYDMIIEARGAATEAVKTAEASSKGFAGPVAVKLTVDENNAIAAIVIGDDKFAETEGFGTKALEPAFAESFKGKALPLKDGDIDVITGATVTSEAVIAAVNKAYEKLLAQ